MDVLKKINSNSVSLIVRFVVISLFFIFVYIKYPTQESQEKSSISSYNFHKKRQVIGKVQKLFKGDHNVSYLLVNDMELIIDDTTYFKLKIGDSIYKKANSNNYYIFRNTVLVDSSDIREYYLGSLSR